MNLKRLVISAALLAAVGAFMGHAPSEMPEAAAVSVPPGRPSAPAR